MPTPPRTSIEAITAAGREILDAHGLPGLTMQAVALVVGVKPPSLYKHVVDRDALVGLVADAAARELSAHLTDAYPTLTTEPSTVNSENLSLTAEPSTVTPENLTLTAGHPTLATLTRALRAWATSHPEAYRLVFSGRGSAEAALATSGSVLAIARSLAGDKDALVAARLITAWATGFISMELAGAFQLGGDVEAAFDYALAHLTGSLAGTQAAG